MKNQRKLRNYLIKRKMQIRITVQFLAFTLVASLLSGGVVYLVLWPTLSRLITPDIFPVMRANFVFILFWDAVLIALVIFIIGIIITHRIAGPLYNIENKLDKALKGEDIELIHLRKGDELQELSAKVNMLLQELKKSGPS
jgi:signal peptidase II